MKNGRIQIHTAKMENKTTNRAKMSNKRCIKARLQYFTQRGYKASEVTSRATCCALRQRFSSLTCLILPLDFLSFVFLSFLFFVSEKNGLKMTVFAHSQTTNKLANEAAKDSARSQAWKKNVISSTDLRCFSFKGCIERSVSDTRQGSSYSSHQHSFNTSSQFLASHGHNSTASLFFLEYKCCCQHLSPI